MLEVRDVTKHFGGVNAVDGVSFRVERGEILGLIGPNGAGKTTLIDTICGLEKADTGEILFKNRQITDLEPYKIARMGIGRTFQITRVFKKMTALDNMYVPNSERREKLGSIRKDAIDLLEFYDLVHLKDTLAGNLSGGQQKLLELARVTMMDPDLFCLDEPFFGIHSVIKRKIIKALKVLNKTREKTILVVSHDIPTILGLCKRVIVMSTGNLIADGSPENIQNNEKVLEAYLGG